MDAWELFSFLLVCSVHGKTVINSSHVLRRPKVLQNILQILAVAAYVRR